MYKMSYPEYAHLGFKILCTFWGIHSINYMNIMIHQKQKIIDLMTTKNEKITELIKRLPLK